MPQADVLLLTLEQEIPLLLVGDKFERTYVVTEERHAHACALDPNPIHTGMRDEQTGVIKLRRVHGFVLYALISADVAEFSGDGTMATDVEPHLRTLWPVKPGDTIELLYTVTDIALEGKRKVTTFTVVVTVKKRCVLSGTVKAML